MTKENPILIEDREELIYMLSEVNGAAGAVAASGGQLFAVLGFTVRRGKIVEIDVVADPARLRQLDLAVLGD